jgi:hypothetical protein
MKPTGTNLYETMRQHRADIRKLTETKLAEAKEAYDAALATARAASGLTNDPTCVPCTRCRRPVGKRCVTNAKHDPALRKPTTPHSVRSYDYAEAVKAVHHNDIVVASKTRLDELQVLYDGANYDAGRSTSAVQIGPRASLYVTIERIVDNFVGYRPVYLKNILGVRPDTLFSHAELNFMLAGDVDVHVIGSTLRDALSRLSKPLKEAPPGELAPSATTRRKAEIAEFARQIRAARYARGPVEPQPVVDEDLLDAIMKEFYGS